MCPFDGGRPPCRRRLPQSRQPVDNFPLRSPAPRVRVSPPDVAWEAAPTSREEPGRSPGAAGARRDSGRGRLLPTRPDRRGSQRCRVPDQRGAAVVPRTTRWGGEDDLARRGAALVEALDGGRHRMSSLFLRPLTDRGQIEAAQPGEPVVVVAGHGHLAGDGDAGACERGQDPDGALVVVGDDGGGQVAGVEEVAGGAFAGRFGVVPVQDPDGGVQAMATHRGAVPAAPVRGDHALAAVHVRHRAVPESHQVVDDLADPVVVRGAHDVQFPVGDPTADGDDGRLAVEGGERVGGGGGAEQDPSLAAKGQQCLDRGVLVAGAGLGAQDEVVADLLGGRVQMLDQFGMKGAVDVDHDAEQPGASAGQEAGGSIDLVAQFGGGPQNPLPGALAGSGHTAQHQGDGRRGHAHTGRHVLQPWALRRAVPATFRTGFVHSCLLAAISSPDALDTLTRSTRSRVSARSTPTTCAEPSGSRACSV